MKKTGMSSVEQCLLYPMSEASPRQCYIAIQLKRSATRRAPIIIRSEPWHQLPARRKSVRLASWLTPRQIDGLRSYTRRSLMMISRGIKACLGEETELTWECPTRRHASAINGLTLPTQQGARNKCRSLAPVSPSKVRVRLEANTWPVESP